MPRLSSLSVTSRLVLIVALALLAALVVAATGLFGIRQASDAAAVLVQRHLPASSLVGDLRAGVGNLRRYEKDAFLHTGNPAGIENYLPKWKAALQDSQQTLATMRTMLGGEAEPILASLALALDNYGRGFDSVSVRLLRGEFGDANYANQAMEPLKADIRNIDQQIGTLKKHIDAAAAAEKEQLAALQGRQWWLQGGTLAAVALLLGSLAWALVKSITGPLASASAALARLAGGDLSQPIHARGSDELGHMMRRLADTQRALRELVQTIQGNAHSVASASAQIAQGNADLSQRTERQAASLQQTAASMAQLTATVQTGTDTARQADELAQAASTGARRGGEVVAQVVQTMAGIQQASRRIADITSVIDGIAFQTNILALNAAVEAARAGEQGRGFAVVASEVRTLAQRSAAAAREIKSLIGDSVERVEAGHELVQQAGTTIGEVVGQVQRVTQLMGEMSAVAHEQQQGIAEVGQAVQRLDESTQQNAALVEESAAAAASLRQQAEQLSGATAVFRLQAA